jgi:hypothetical protein
MDRRPPTFAPNHPKRPSLWLAAAHGRRLPRTHELLAAIDEPETPLEVEFEGLTEAEQEAALKGFPGGKRFRLAHRH